MFRFLFRPRWLLFHLLVVGGIVLLMNLGFWQLDRLSQRKAFNSEVIERSEQAPVELSSILGDLAAGRLDPAGAEWRRVTVRGTYVADQVIQYNNFQNGRAGNDVLTAMVVDTDDTVIVNRGFVPLGVDLPPAPGDDVDVLGYIRPSEVRGRGELTDTSDGGTGALTETRRIDIPRLSAQFPGEVAPVYVQLIDAKPPPTVGEPEPVVLPELDNGPHLSYAIQWFIFSVCVVVGWVLAVRRSLRVRAAERRAEDADLPPAADVVAASRHG